MAAGAQPDLMGLMARVAQQRAGAGAANPMGGPAGPSGADPAKSGQAVAQQLSQLQGVDPQAILKQINDMYQGVVALIPHTAFSVPKVANELTAVMKSLSKAKAAAEEALQTLSTVQGIGFSPVSGGGQSSGAPGGAGQPTPGNRPMPTM